MKNDGIHWGYVMGQLLSDASRAAWPGAFTVDENGCLVEDYLDSEPQAPALDPSKAYRLCDGCDGEDEDAQDDLLFL